MTPLKNNSAVNSKPILSDKEMAKLKQAYFASLIKYILEEEKKGKKIPKSRMSAIKTKLCREYRLFAPPKDNEILMSASVKDLEKLKYLKSKPTRSMSGVAVVALMTRPEKCPHGKCMFCPGGVSSNFGNTPQSYTGFEPATRRAIRNDYDSFLQVFNRLEQYVLTGHNPNKVDIIIMGGTFPSYPLEYQYDFVINIFLAMNVFSKLFYIPNKDVSLDNLEMDYAKFKKWFQLPHSPDNPKIEDKLKKKLYTLKEKEQKKIKYSNTASIQNKIQILEKLKLQNESSAIRCIGLTQETRPDYSLLDHAKTMLSQGTTRVELGVQSVFEEVVKKAERGHTVKQSIIATKILKDLGFKINYHMMLGLPGSDAKKDLLSLQTLFKDQNFQPDMLKIYPCLLIKGTKLYDEYKKGNYSPIEIESATEVIGKFLVDIPEYVRVMRIQRDIPSTLVEGGVQKTNLRQYVDNWLKKRNLVSKEIRSRELARVNSLTQKPSLSSPQKYHSSKLSEINLKITEYDASDGKEFFISAEDSLGNLSGFCRLRFVSQSLTPEITKNSAIIRELHVYGSALNIGEESILDGSSQHKGWGKKLVKAAEEIAIKNKKEKILVISGVGVREYYRKLGYVNDGYYVSKLLN